MKRSLELIGYDQANERVKRVYDDILRTLQKDKVPNLFQVMAHDETMLEINWQKYKYTSFEQKKLPALLKQLILFIVSVKTGNKYCVDAHSYSALYIDQNLQYDDLTNIVDGYFIETLPKSYQKALSIIKAAIDNPCGFSSGDITFEQELKEVGFDDDEIEEIFAQMEVGEMINVFCMFHHVPLEEPDYWLNNRSIV